MPSQTMRECPFCKSVDVELVVSQTERAGKWKWWDAHISCHSCRARTGTFEGETKAEAVAYAVDAWNRRAANDKQMEDKQRDAAIAERDRLRDIVRRLVRVAQDTLVFAEAMSGIVPDNPERAKARSEITSLLREARAAIGEVAP